MLIVLSLDPETKYSPLGENTMLCTQLEWPMKVYMNYPLDTLHIQIVFSVDPARYSPFREKITQFIQLD